MRSKKLEIAEIGIGDKGASCLFLMHFGMCARAGCLYDHDPVHSMFASTTRNYAQKINEMENLKMIG